MRGFFRPRKPAVNIQQVTREDMVTAHAWGLKLTEWYALTDFERSECRRLITTAPHFEEAAA